MGSALGRAMKQIGSNLSGDGKTCPNCGKPLDRDDWCRNCGYDLREVEQERNETSKPVQSAPVKSNLVKCPDCGRMVSRNATSCPGCGCPFETEQAEPERKSGSGGVFVAVVLGIIVAVWLLTKILHVEITGTIVPIK